MRDVTIPTVALWGALVEDRLREPVDALFTDAGFQRRSRIKGELQWLATPSRHVPIPLFMTHWSLPEGTFLGILVSEEPVQAGESRESAAARAETVPAWEREQFNYVRQECQKHGIGLPPASLISLPLLYCEISVYNAPDRLQMELPDDLVRQLVIWNRFLETEWFSLFEAYMSAPKVEEVTELLYDLLLDETILGFRTGRR